VQQRRLDEEQEQQREHCGHDQLQPPGRPHEARDETADRTEGEHQEGELERVDLDDDEQQDQPEPEHPCPAGDHIGFHGGIPSTSCLETITATSCGSDADRFARRR